MSDQVQKSLLDIDFAQLTRGRFTPSPAAWEDQVLYFLMLDRFSDGREKRGYGDEQQDRGRLNGHDVATVPRASDGTDAPRQDRRAIRSGRRASAGAN